MQAILCIMRLLLRLEAKIKLYCSSDCIKCQLRYGKNNSGRHSGKAELAAHAPSMSHLYYVAGCFVLPPDYFSAMMFCVSSMCISPFHKVKG